jgi:hypothetical protein
MDVAFGEAEHGTSGLFGFETEGVNLGRAAGLVLDQSAAVQLGMDVVPLKPTNCCN